MYCKIYTSYTIFAIYSFKEKEIQIYFPQFLIVFIPLTSFTLLILPSHFSFFCFLHRTLSLVSCQADQRSADLFVNLVVVWHFRQHPSIVCALQ